MNHADGRSRRTFLAALAGGTALTAGCNALQRRDVDATPTRPDAVHWQVEALASTLPDDGERVREALYEAGGLSRDVDVRVDTGPTTADDPSARLYRALAAGEPTPDLLVLTSRWLHRRPFVSHLATLPSVAAPVAERVDDDYAPAAARLGRDPGTGTQYGLPVTVDVPTVLYRRDLVEQAGYSPGAEDWATSPLTWRRFSRVLADAADAADGDGTGGFATQLDRYRGTACCSFNEVLSSWGGAYFGGGDHRVGHAGDRPVTVEDDAAADALGMLRRFVAGTDAEGFDDYAGGVVPADALAWTEQPSLEAFLAGDVVALRNWPYALPRAAAEDAVGEALGAMPVPAGVEPSATDYPGAGGSTPVLGASQVVLNANSNRRDEATAVLRALARPATQRRLRRDLGWLPPRPALFDGAGDGPLARFDDALRTSVERAVAMPAGPQWADEAVAIARRVNAALAGEQGVDEALSSLAEELRSIEAAAGEN